MEPRVSKRENKLHLSYELRQRVHCSQISSIRAPNGSTVIVYGHDSGLRVLWRGGPRRKESSQQREDQRASGVRESQDVIVIDDDENEGGQQLTSNHGVPAEYEQELEDDEEDPDCPYPNVVGDVDIDLGTEVLNLDMPSTTSMLESQLPSLIRSHVVVTVACANGRLSVLTIPLTPPRTADKETFIQKDIGEKVLREAGDVASEVIVKIVSPSAGSEATSTRIKGKGSVLEGELVVATATNSLNIWYLDILPATLALSEDHAPRNVYTPLPARTLSFHPLPTSQQMLLSDRSGAVRIYDPIAGSSGSGGRPSSSDSVSAQLTHNAESGKWIAGYLSPFAATAEGCTLARRKHVVDAVWVLGGRGILALLGDGEWGMWDQLAALQRDKSTEDFALHGLVGSSAEVVDTAKPKKGNSKLAPMTPNTRKTRSENLFRGPPKAQGIASRGGISVINNSTRTAQSDESIIMWFGSDIYSITSMQAFWQRSANSSGGFGSLYAPRLTHVSAINLMNENITSVSQFSTRSTTSRLGQLNTQRDLMVSAEHRLVILQSVRPPTLSKGLFQQATSGQLSSRDQDMLYSGELDVGGMDRMLDGMDGGRTRRVGFAH